MKHIHRIKLLQENLSDLQVLINDDAIVPYGLLKEIICGLAGILKIICDKLPDEMETIK